MIIESRFNGPPDSGNGGYSAGVLATTLIEADAAEVTLRQPPPLGVPLTAAVNATGLTEVHGPDGGLVAQVVAVNPFTATVPRVSWAEAVRAAESYAGFTDHPFPTCYVCGPDRKDGLQIFPGRLPDGRTAAPFIAPAHVTSATVWAALDCPGGWAIIAPGRPYVLGRMAAVVSALPATGDQCVVMGTMVQTEGRKALVHSTLYGPAGDTLAYARATWIAI
ncbi:MAG TPA: hypothetical protein VFX61_10365 [Micromonosporaceae bacterium]|nr:hypothetical protein [Micromonosporaceae bacterium]